MTSHHTTRGRAAAKLADALVAMSPDDRRYEQTLADLQRRCDEAGIDVTVLLDEAQRRAETADVSDSP